MTLNEKSTTHWERLPRFTLSLKNRILREISAKHQKKRSHFAGNLLYAVVTVLLLSVVTFFILNLETQEELTTPIVTPDDEPLYATYEISGFYMIDEKHGWGLSNNKVLTTKDGGLTWLDVSPENLYSPYTNEMIDRFYLNKDESWISITNLEEIEIYHTLDGGKNWDKRIVPKQEIFSLQSFFINSKTGWILGETEPAMGRSDKTILRTNRNGNDWETATSPHLPRGGYPTGISFSNERNGYITYPYYLDEFIPVYKTIDGGESWALLKLEEPTAYTPSNGYNSSAFPPVFSEDGQRGILLVRFISTEESVYVPYVTDDGGETWNDIKGVFAQYSWFLNPSVGWAIDYYQNILYMTKDGAENWISIYPNIDLNNTYYIQFISAEIGWAILDEVYKTIDGGKTWERVKR